MIAVLALAGASCAGLGPPVGPWMAQIVDADTGKPLEGVVVLAVWVKKYPIHLGNSGGYLASDEVLTDADGHFVIGARRIVTLDPFARVPDYPELTIFKRGHGQWRFQGSKDWSKDAYKREAQAEAAWAQLVGAGAVI